MYISYSLVILIIIIIMCTKSSMLKSEAQAVVVEGQVWYHGWEVPQILLLHYT